MSDRPTRAPEPSPTGRAAFVLARLRSSLVLRTCMALAFVEYGALLVLAVFGDRLRTASRVPDGVWFPFAGWLALCSLGSWFFLFLWLGRYQDLRAHGEVDPSALAAGRVLEGVATLCIAVVHGLLGWILLLAVTG